MDLLIAVQFFVREAEENVRLAYYKLMNPQQQISSYVFDTVRALVPEMPVDHVFSEKEKIAAAVKERLADPELTPYYEFTLGATVVANPEYKDQRTLVGKLRLELENARVSYDEGNKKVQAAKEAYDREFLRLEEMEPTLPGEEQVKRIPNDDYNRLVGYQERHEEEIRYPNPEGGHELAGTLTLPRSAGPHPAVVLVSGSGPQDRDELVMQHRPFLVLSDQYAGSEVAPLGLYNACLCYQELEQWQAFLRTGEEFLERYPGDERYVDVLLQMAEVHQNETGEFTEAMAAYEALLGLPDAPRTQAHYQLGECQMKLGLVDEAKASFRASAEEPPGLADDYAIAALARVASLMEEDGDLATVRELPAYKALLAEIRNQPPPASEESSP